MDSMLALYRAWWADVPNRHSPETARTYRYLALRALADLRGDARRLGRADIERYLAGFRTRTANQMRSALVDLYGFLMRRGIVATNPLATIPTRRERRRRLRRALSEDELVRALVAAVWLGVGKRRFTGERIALLMLGAYYAGLRPGEIIHLTTDRVNLARAEIEVVDTKSGNDRVVPLCEPACRVYAELVRDRVGLLSDVGRTQFWERVRRATAAAEIPTVKRRPYALRHSFASHLLERGVDQRTVSDLMGHEDLRSLWDYTIPDNDHRRAAVARLERGQA